MQREFPFEDESVVYYPATSTDLGALFGVPLAPSATSLSALSLHSAPPFASDKYVLELRTRHETARPPSPAEDAADERSGSAWWIGLTKQFKNSVAHIDRKRQGRIFEAVMSLTENPMAAVGDTVKPLTNDKKGYWRRRVGDYRLTYLPDPASGCITLVSFEARGSAYA